jgi:hypothetical protein
LADVGFCFRGSPSAAPCAGSGHAGIERILKLAPRPHPLVSMRQKAGRGAECRQPTPEPVGPGR